MTYAQHDPDLHAAAERAAFRLSPEAWAACRRDYEDAVPVIVLEERYSVGARQIRRKAAEEGWQRHDHKARRVLACLDNNRALPDFNPPRPSDETLELLSEATRHENISLLVRPDAQGLTQFAARRAAEEAARGAPQQTLLWLRVVEAAERNALRLDSVTRRPGGGDALRAALLSDLEDEILRLRHGDDDDAAEEEDTPNQPPIAD